jgi:hypothetical protein
MDSRLKDLQSRIRRMRSLCRIFTGRGRGIRLNLVLLGIGPGGGRRVCMDGTRGTVKIIVVAQDQDQDKMNDMHLGNQDLGEEKTMYIYLADPILGIDTHLDKMIDTARDQDQGQDHEKEDLHLTEISVIIANHHLIYLPSHLNGIRISHHQSLLLSDSDSVGRDQLV